MIRRILCFLVIAGAGCQRPREAVVIPAQPQPCQNTQLFVYGPKTDTLVAAYSDSSMTIPIANPITISCGEKLTFWVAGDSRVVTKVLP